jgi:Fe-S oxidoreductase
MQEKLVERAKALLADGSVTRVIGWRRGDFGYDQGPGIFTTAAELERDFVYDDFCGANLSKFLVTRPNSLGKTLIFIKSCDSYSLNQLLREHRVKREAVYVVAIPCAGKVDPERLFQGARPGGLAEVTRMESDGQTVRAETLYGEVSADFGSALAERCRTCKSKAHALYDELIGDEGTVIDAGRFDPVEKLEAMTSEERYEFWRGELSRCLRCNACRDACPACTCERCVFDNEASGVANKAAADPFEENMFHIIRAYHVAGRCTDCGECSRVCPEHIPLHLLNRKMIKDINQFYGDYQAGADLEAPAPLNAFLKEDPEPAAALSRAGRGEQ